MKESRKGEILRHFYKAGLQVFDLFGRIPCPALDNRKQVPAQALYLGYSITRRDVHAVYTCFEAGRRCIAFVQHSAYLG